MKKLLHLSFHRGAAAEIRWVMDKLGIAVEDFHFDDGTGNERYNMTPERSERLWSQIQKRADEFDWILTSDTAALARPFILHRNDFRGRLIVWVNNRFDYWHGRKPDALFYKQYREAAAMPDTLFVPYSEFEAVHAASHGVEMTRKAIRPIGMGFGTVRVARNERYFLPPYGNDAYFAPFMPKVLSKDLFEHRRYEGPADIARFRAIIHIPYAWSTYALFEHWAQGMVYYLPSLSFYKKLWKQGSLFFPDANYNQYWPLSEWWRKENRANFIYFNGWKELKQRLFLTRRLKLKIEEKLSREILKRHAVHRQKTLEQWQNALNKPIAPLKKSRPLFSRSEIPVKKRVAIILTATNRYVDFFGAFYEKAELHFLPGVQKHYFVMTDCLSHPVFEGKSNVTPVYVEHRPWPYPTLLRFRYIVDIAGQLKDFTHLAAIDVDSAVTAPVEEKEFFGHGKPLYGVRHPGFIGKKGTFETNLHSRASVTKKDNLSVYWAGGLWGGEMSHALALAGEIARRIEDDLLREVMAVWHDESHLNKYFIENRKKVHVFHPGYMYPESADLPYPKKILALDKNHTAVRHEKELSEVPPVSVVMPVFNSARYLSEAIDSILNQSFSDFEFIIVDDGSSDASPEILRRYAAKDARIRVITQENKGIVESLNTGCRLARGRYIARMDADDVSLPARLERQFEIFEKNPRFGVIGTSYSLIRKGGGDYYAPEWNAAIQWTLCFYNAICHPSVMMRREVLEKLNYYRPIEHCEDYDLWVRAAKVTTLYNIPEILLRYRISEEGVSKKFSAVQNENHLKIMQSLMTGFCGKEVPAEEVKVLRQADAFPDIENSQKIQAAEKLLENIYKGMTGRQLAVPDLQWVTQDYYRRRYILSAKAALKKPGLSSRFKKLWSYARYFYYANVRPKIEINHVVWRFRDRLRKMDNRFLDGRLHAWVYLPPVNFMRDLFGGIFFNWESFKTLRRLEPGNTLVITHVYNRSDFLPLQKHGFEKFLKDEHFFVVFNDAADKAMEQEIFEQCRKLKRNHVRIPQRVHSKPYLERVPGESLSSAPVRCANVVQYSLDQLGFRHKGPVLLIDSDMFLVKNFSVGDYLKGYDIAGVPQSRSDVEYIWNGLVMINMKTLPHKKMLNFNCGLVNGVPVDAGGQTYHYFKKNPEARLRWIDNAAFNSAELHELMTIHQNNLKNFGFDDRTVAFLEKRPSPVEFLAANAFVHYRGGTNWDCQSEEFHRTKTKLFREYVLS